MSSNPARTNNKTDRSAAVTLQVPPGVADDIEAVLRRFAEEAEVDTSLVVDHSGYLIAGISAIPDVDVDTIGNRVAEASGSAEGLTQALGEEGRFESLHLGEDRILYLRDIGERFILVGVSDANIPAGILRDQANLVEEELARHLTRVKAIPASLTSRKNTPQTPPEEPEPEPVSLRQSSPSEKPDAGISHSDANSMPEPRTPVATPPDNVPSRTAAEPARREEPMETPSPSPTSAAAKPIPAPQGMPAVAIPPVGEKASDGSSTASGDSPPVPFADEVPPPRDDKPEKVEAPTLPPVVAAVTARKPAQIPVSPPFKPAAKPLEQAVPGTLDTLQARTATSSPPREEDNDPIPESIFEFDDAGADGEELEPQAGNDQPPKAEAPSPIENKRVEPPSPIIENSPFEMDTEEEDESPFERNRPSSVPVHLSVPAARKRASESKNENDDEDQTGGPRYSFELG